MGIRLAELPLSDFFDVIHFFFEEDFARVSSHEQMVVIDNTRTYIYETLYGVPYKHSTKQSNDFQYIDDLIDEDLGSSEDSKPVDPFARPDVVKPYIAPTKVNANSSLPFGKGIDAPIG